MDSRAYLYRGLEVFAREVAVASQKVVEVVVLGLLANHRTVHLKIYSHS